MNIRDLFEDVTIDEKAILQIIDENASEKSRPTIADIRKEYHIRKLSHDHGVSKLLMWITAAAVVVLVIAIVGCKLKKRLSGRNAKTTAKETDGRGNTYIFMNTIEERLSSTDPDPSTETEILTSPSSSKPYPAKPTKKNKFLRFS